MELTEFLDSHGVEWSKDHKHSRTGWTQLSRCPRCHSTNYHLGITDSMDRASCYICGGFSVPGLLKNVTGASWKSVYELLGKRDFVLRETQELTGRYVPPTNLLPIEDVYHARMYVKGRDFDPDYLETVWGCQATNGISDYPFRLFIPVIRNRHPVSWTARAVCGQEPRYVTSRPDQSSVDAKKCLLGIDKVRNAVVVCEGAFDAFRVGVGAVATLGLSVTPEQMLALSRVQNRYVCFDNSTAAQNTASALCDNLSVYPGKTVRICLEADDPGSASKKEIRALRDMVFGVGK